MTNRDHTPKVSEIFKDAHYAFSEKASFERAFPEIDEIKIEVSETGYGAGGYGGSTSRIYEKNVGEFIDCSNPQCYKGGFSVGSLLRRMVRNKETDAEVSGLCKGYEGSSKDKSKYRDCINCFQVKIVIKYRETSEDTPSQISE